MVQWCKGGISKLPNDRHVAGCQYTCDAWGVTDEVSMDGTTAIKDLMHKCIVGCGALLS